GATYLSLGCSSASAKCDEQMWRSFMAPFFISALATSHLVDTPSQSFEIKPFDAPLGAEIIGLDLTQPLNDIDFARVHRAHLDHGLLVFRDQRITPQQQLELSRRFGPLQIQVLQQF